MLLPKLEMKIPEGMTMNTDVDNITDALGLPIDEGIKPLVAALRAWGINTSASCEGHTDRGNSYPWIIIDIQDVLPTLKLVSWQNRPRVEDGSENRNLWVIMPEPGGISLVPWDTSSSLEILQERAKEFARNLEERKASGWEL